MQDKLSELIVNAEALVSSGYYGQGARHYEGASLSRSLTTHATFPVIAEIKLASPSMGRLSTHGPRKLIDDYVRGGAAALSVLTEPRFFNGSLKNLELGRQSGLPMLMKDVVINEDQVRAASLHGAGAVLLIQEVFDHAISAGRRDDLIDCAHNWGLEVVLEATSEEGLNKARDSEADLLGINQRDLRTLKVDLTKAMAFLPLLSEEDRPIIVMSGIGSRAVIEGIRDHGGDAVLVGGHLSSAKDAEETLRALEVPR
jgi:indole-3-glycerol phosphate synthase